MLQHDPKKRLSAQQLSQHQFLTKNTEEFKTVDTSQISYKINKYGVLTLNIINNETIKRLYPFNPNNNNNKNNEIFNSLTINLDLISDNIYNYNKTTSNQDNSPKSNINQNDINNEKQQDITKSQKQIKNDYILKDIPQTETMIYLSNIQSTHINLNKLLGKANSQEIKTNNIINQENVLEGIHSAKSENTLSKLNSDKYQVKFEVKRNDNKKENFFLNIWFLVKENDIRHHDVFLRDENGFYDEWIWKIHSNDWKNIDNNNEAFIMIILYNESSGNNNAFFNLESLKLGKSISFVVKKYINFKLIPIIKE